MNLEINEYKPSASLSAFVELFWKGNFNLNSTRLFTQRVIPNGYVELVIHTNDSHCELLQGSDFSYSPDYLLIGIHTKPYDVNFRSNVKVFGIRFKPEGVYSIFGIPAADIHHNFIDAESVFCKLFKEFCSSLRESESVSQMIFQTEDFLNKRISSRNLNVNYLIKAADIIRKSNCKLSVEQLAEKVNISTRQLEREFKYKLGMSPKSYMRIARLNAVNRRILNGERVDLTALSFSSGYADQAHFIRDFKNFTGESPKIFLGKKDQYLVNPNTADLVC